MTIAALKRSMCECPAFRISPNDTNYMALVFDPEDEDCPAIAVVEIFEVGGRTPPNVHRHATEFFFVLHGRGRARADGVWSDLLQGDALMVRPGTEHLIENTGTERLYCLTMMVPDEHFASIIRKGTPVHLDAIDRQVLSGLPFAQVATHA